MQWRFREGTCVSPRAGPSSTLIVRAQAPKPRSISAQAEGLTVGFAHLEARRADPEHRLTLDSVANELLKRETLDAQTFKNLINQAGAVSQ